MKIIVRGGHNSQAIGAVGIIDELTEDRAVTRYLVSALKNAGHEAYDVSPGAMSTNDDLYYGVEQARRLGADLFVSIHFNKCYNHYNGAIGSETWVYSKSDNLNDEAYGQRIVNSLSDLGFINRGVKTSADLYELRKCKEYGIPAVIVEVCFVEATDDVSLYRQLGAAKIGSSIASAIANKQVVATQPTVDKGNGSSAVIQKGIVVADGGLNVRSGPGTIHPRVGGLNDGAAVSVHETVNGWHRITSGSLSGWVSAEYVRIEYVKMDNTTASQPSTSGKEYLNLPASATSWNVYPLDKAPVIANACGKLNPSKFGGLSYEILGKPQADVCIIQTSDFGKVQIYTASSTGATITTSPACGGSTSSSSSDGTYGIVTTSVLNVRQGAGTEYAIIGTVRNGEKVKLANKVGNWWAIYYGTNGGFVHSDYISII
nr:MAG TPA: Cell wall hydrolase autolysin [Caudoviricetes sp.]